MEVVATVVEVGLTLGGDLASFDTAAQASLASTLRSALSCEEPACFLTLQLSSGSINVNARLVIPQSEDEEADAASGDSGSGDTTSPAAASVAAVTAAANALVTRSASSLSASLGVTIEAVEQTVGVTSGVATPLVVAPPPPSPPPPTSPPPLAPPPSPLLPPPLIPPPAVPPSLPPDRSAEYMGHATRAASIVGVVFVVLVLVLCTMRRNARMLNARVLPLHMQSPRNGFSPRKSFSSSPVGTLKRSHKTPTKAPALDLAGAGIIDGSALIERGGVRSRDEIDSRESERSQTAWGGGDLGPMLDSSAAAAPDAIDSIDIFSPTSPPSPLSERGGGQPLSQPAGFVQGRIPQRSVAPPMRGGNPTQVGGGRRRRRQKRRRRRSNRKSARS